MVQAALDSRGRGCPWSCIGGRSLSRGCGDWADARDRAESGDGDPAPERCQRRQPAARRVRRVRLDANDRIARRGRGRAASLCLDRQASAVERGFDTAVAIGPIQPRSASLDPGKGLRGGVAVGIDRADRDDRDAWPEGIEDGVGRRCAAAMMGDLEQVDVGQAAGEEDRVDLLLDVAGKQEALGAEGTEEHDRHVVDRRPPVGRVARDRVAIGPQDLQVDRVEAQPVAG
jgi:hypothetical protein